MIQEEWKQNQKQHVRLLLDEMLLLDGWGEKDREQNETKLQQLRGCILDQATEEQLQKLPKRMCAYEFKPGDIAWNCKVCQVDETCVMCNDCFIASDHENHEVFFYYTHSGGCCDCGDTEAWAPEGFCLHHKGAQDANPLAYLSPQLLHNSRQSLSEILKFVFDTIMEARCLAFIQVENVDQVGEKLSTSLPDARFSVIVHYNELQTSQEFASCLAKAHPAIAHQVLKIVAEMSSQKQSIVRVKATAEEAVELAEALYRSRIIVSIVPHEYKSKIPLVTALLTWLASLANLSDGLCRLLCEQFIYPSDSQAIENKMEIEEEDFDSNSQDLILRRLILADAFLPKNSSDALHSLLMALLADPIFKRTFAITFTSCYQQLYREFVQGIGSSSVTILAFGVQFFNRASFVTLLVEEYDLLHVLMNSVLETLRKNRKGICGIPFEGWQLIHQQISSSGSNKDRVYLNVWDLFAIDIQRQDLEMVGDERDLLAIEAEAMNSIVGHRFISLHPWRDSNFFHLAQETQLPGRFELDVASPVFLYRRYMSGLLDLRYALQIEGVSEAFILAQDGQRFTEFLLFLSALQGVCAETRRFGDHVEMESRGWVVAVEFVSTASDVFTWILTNLFKNLKSTHRDQDMATLRRVIYAIARPIMDAYYFWLASCGKYFAPKEFHVGETLQPDQVETHVSCHFPIHRLLVQLVRTLCDCPKGLEIFYEMIHSSEDEISEQMGEKDCLWLHTTKSSLGFWHRVQLIEPALQAIVWDAQVHSGMWVRNGLSVINHSMNYGEPPFCLRFRDLDLMLVQFGFQLLGIQWMMTSIADRFGVSAWFEENVPKADCKDIELMVTECLTLICQLATELPPKYLITSTGPLKILLPYLRRQIVQRLCVGPCAHSDLSKIASEFFVTHENLFSTNFSTGPVLDQILKEICVGSGGNESYAAGGIGSGTGASDVSTSTGGGGKFLYRLKPDLLSEYCPTFIHLTRKQHEAAHENWFQERLRRSRLKEQQQDEADGSSWLDFPMTKSFLPCAYGFENTRLAILHKEARQLVYQALYKAKTDSQYNLTILSRAVTLFTLQVYLVEEIRYLETTNPLTSSSNATERHHRETSNLLIQEFLEWTLAAVPTSEGCRDSPLMVLLKLNPWNLTKAGAKGQGTTSYQSSSTGGGGSDFTTVGGALNGDQKHETGRGIDWLVHRLCRLSMKCKQVVEANRIELQARATATSKEDEDRRVTMAQRKKEAQMRALAAMQQRQAAFAEQVKKMMMAEGSPDDEGDQITTGGDAISGNTMISSGTTSIIAANGVEEMEDIEGKPPNPLGSDGSLEDTADVPECAMCHSDSFENSFMCFVGFAQSSAVMSRLNNGSYGPFFSTPMDEMHLGEEVPVHLRMCGHAVHHSCWKSYHASQFQRAITGGHHRHALNAVDVTKGEFLCPLCKSISNVLIPYTTHEMDNVSFSTHQSGELFAPPQRSNQVKRHRSSSDSSSSDSKLRRQQQEFYTDLLHWVHDIGVQAINARRISIEHQHRPSPPHPPFPPNQLPPAVALSVAQSSSDSGPSGNNIDTEIPVSQLEEKFGLGSVVLDEKTKWLEDGLGSLCMAIHKVACGATERSRPERYTRSASNALFHSLICTFLASTFMTATSTGSVALPMPSSSPTSSSMTSSSSDHLQAELRFLKAMKFLPLLMEKVMKKNIRQKLLKLSSSNTLEWNAEIKSLLHFGGSEITEDGTIVLEEEHPSTQTQTRKQSLWGKVRWPKKPLLLTHLGGVLSQGLLLAPNEMDAVHSARLIVLARLIQTLVWSLVARQHDFAQGIDRREYREEEVDFFIQVFFDEPSHTTVEHAAEQVWTLNERISAELSGVQWSGDGEEREEGDKNVLDKKQLLNLVACEVVPMVKVASFLLYSLYPTGAIGNGLTRPTQISIDQVNRIGFIKLDAFSSGNATSPRECGSSGGTLNIQQGLFVLVSRWIQRFKAGYEEMNDPQGLLHQWLTGINIGNGFKLTFPIILLRDLNTMHRSLSVLCAGFSRTSYLRSLPRAYVKFYAHLAKRKCESCHQFPSRPAVCLLCGMLLCAANTCPSIQPDKGYPEEANPGACTIHAKKCGRGVGMFLLVLEGAVLLVYWKLAAYVGSLYVDEYGEEFGERNRDLSKGRPLYLHEERRERLMRLWLRHEIPNEVVKIQNSSERVIRNSHY